MPKEFLKQIANIQNLDVFGTQIEATKEAMVTQGIHLATDTLNRAAEELNILSGSKDMKTIDENIDRLSKDADVTDATKSVEELARNMTMLTEEVSKKKKAFGDVYDSTIASLAAIGGDDAARVMNLVAREQGITNKELDAKVDSLNRSIEYQKNLVDLDRGKFINDKYAYDKEERKNLDTARGYIIDNEIFKGFSTLILSDSDETTLRNRREKVDQLVNEVSKASGVNTETVRDALYHMNAFTKLTQEKGSYAKSDRDKSIAKFKNEFNKAIANAEAGTNMWKMASPNAKADARRALAAENAEAAETPEGKILYEWFKPGGEQDLASSTIISIDRWGTQRGVRLSAELSDISDMVGGKALPMDISKRLDETYIYNDPKYRGLIIHHNTGESLRSAGKDPETGEPIYRSPYTDIGEERALVESEIAEYQNLEKEEKERTKVDGKEDKPSWEDTWKTPLTGGAISTFPSPAGDQTGRMLTFATMERDMQAKAEKEEFDALTNYNKFVMTIDPDLKIDITDIPFGKRRLGFKKDILSGKYNIEDDDPIDYDIDLLNQTLSQNNFFEPEDFGTARTAVKEMANYEPEIQESTRILKEKDAVHGLFSDNDIDPIKLMRSLWSQESLYNPSAISYDKKGNPVAYGIGQIKPDTMKKDIYPLFREEVKGDIPPRTDEGIMDILMNPRLNMISSMLYVDKIARDIKRSFGHNAVTKENVLSVYHSGWGNFVKSYTNTESLGPRGREYPNKVNRFYKLLNVIEK